MATLANMGIPAAGAGILHPKQASRWQVRFSNLGKLVSGATSRDLTRQATSIARPSLKFNEIAIHRYNSTAYVAGKHEWEPINLTIEDDITGLASAAVQAQLETQQRLIGADISGVWLNAAATGSDYKFGTIIEQLDGNETVIETWNLEGCFIASANYGDLKYDGNEAVTIQLSIRFDHARQVLTGQGFGTALGGNI